MSETTIEQRLAELMQDRMDLADKVWEERGWIDHDCEYDMDHGDALNTDNTSTMRLTATPGPMTRLLIERGWIPPHPTLEGK